MATTIVVPASGELGEEITLSRWLVSEGDQVRPGDPLAEIEADKGILSIDAVAAGTMLRLLVREGEAVRPGAVLGWLGSPGETVPGAADSGAADGAGRSFASAAGAEDGAWAMRPESAKAAGSRRIAGAADGAGESAEAARRLGGARGAGPARPLAAPAVRRLAASRGLDLGAIPGTGPGGIVLRRDVQRFAEAGGATGGRPQAAVAAEGSFTLEWPWKGRVVDLSHPLHPGKEEYFLNLQIHDTTELYPQYKKDPDVWYILSDVHMSSHCGTHIEFPYHHNRHGMDAGRFPLRRLVSPCVLLDYRHKEPGQAVTLEELQRGSPAIREGDSVLFNFGCARFYRTERSHDRPYIALEAVRWLALDRRINLIGSDASGIEIKGAPNQPNHQLLMDNGIPIIEFAANLDALRRERFLLLVLALNVAGLDSCPVRLIALEEP